MILRVATPTQRNQAIVSVGLSFVLDDIGIAVQG